MCSREKSVAKVQCPFKRSDLGLTIWHEWKSGNAKHKVRRPSAILQHLNAPPTISETHVDHILKDIKIQKKPPEKMQTSILANIHGRRREWENTFCLRRTANNPGVGSNGSLNWDTR